MQITAQAIGIVGAAIAIASFQCRSNKKFFIMQCVSTLLFTTHFFLLGAYTGFILNALGFLRSVILFNRGKKWAQSPIFLWGLMAAFLVTGILTFNGIFSLFPTAAMLISTAFMWTDDGKKIRTAQFFAVSPLWLIYNISVFSISGIITESFNLISVAISFIRYRKTGFSK